MDRRSFIFGMAASVASVAAPVRAFAQESRNIRYVTYNKDAVVKVHCALGVSTMIQFAQGELITAMAAGDTVGFSVVAKKGAGFIFVKPMRAGAQTNLNVITTRRTYALVLIGSHSPTLRANFHVRFKYPDEDVNAKLLAEAEENVRNPSLKNINEAGLNYDYGYKGDGSLKPRVVFDDGRKMFLQFTGDVPAIFVVEDSKGRESLINLRREGEYMIVDKVAAQFTLRAGEKTLCLYNHGFYQPKPRDPIEDIYGPRKIAKKQSLFGPNSRESNR